MKKLLYIGLILSVFSCKTITVYNESQHTTSQNITIGTVGMDKDFVIEHDYNNIAIPEYNNPIKVNANLIPFNKTSFKAFQNAQTMQSANIDVAYADTIEVKPKYLKLEISDRLEVINSLSNDVNTDVFELLKNNKETHIVTSVTIVLKPSQMELVANAEELFLEGYGIKNYSLNIYKDGQFQEQIKFNEGIVFAYQTSNCCWKQNDKYQLEIIDLVEANDNCPNNSFKSSNRAKKKINYYKF